MAGYGIDLLRPSDSANSVCTGRQEETSHGRVGYRRSALECVSYPHGQRVHTIEVVPLALCMQECLNFT